MISTISRRGFIGAMAAVGSSGVVAPAWAVKPKRKIGVALVGLGGYSTNLLAPGLQLTEHCELRGIVTGSPEKIPQWQKQYGIKDANVYNYDNMSEVANNPDIDVMYIVLPTFLHKKYSVIAANAGKHVWCEKPMAMSVDECQQIIDACDKNKVKLSIGYRLQHEPNTRTIMHYAHTRPYGPPQSVIAKAGYAGAGAPQDDWRMDRSKGGGALYDMGVYPINAARYATAMEPVAISAELQVHRPELFKNADETAVFTLEFANGLKAEGAASVGKEMNHLKVTARDGWYELQPMQSYTGVKGRTSDGKKLNKTIAHQQATQMDDDALAIINDTDVLVPGSEGLLDIRVVEGALKSAAAGQTRVELI